MDGSSRVETICAVASGVGGGIGVVRVSGPAAAAVAARLVAPWPAAPESHRLYLGRARDPRTAEELDEVLACLMRAPRSYTGEDVLELHAHGGAENLTRLVEAAVAAGARVAEPGEFTRRAFLAGRMDLSRAEAVAEVIAARSARALRLAHAHRRGAIADRVGSFRARLVALLAEVEGRIDFPDEDLDFVAPAELGRRAAALGGEIGALASTWARGRLLVEGAEVVLVGRPNAGKSSLLNALAGEERALVDAAPGTTRDVIEAEVDLGGLRARLVDTAGEREVGEAAEGVEARGIALGRRRRARADVLVLVVDGTAGFGAIEQRLLDGAAAVVIAWNKCDVSPHPRGLPEGRAAVATAATTGAGLEALRAAIRRAAGDAGDDGELAVSSARQREALDEAGTALAAAGAELAAGRPAELAAVDLRVALDRLGRVTGESADEAVLDAVFARFCIGK